MPRRNLNLILAVCAASLLCYRAVDPSHYGRYLIEALDQIQERHLAKPDRHELFNAAMAGMVEQLKNTGDNHSAFESRGWEAMRFEEELKSQFGGIGIEVGMDPKTQLVAIHNTLTDTPAFRAGLLPGDEIAEIDGHSIHGLPLDKTTSLMRGKPGERITLTIERPGHAERLVFGGIVREIIKVPTVLGDRRAGPNDDWVFTLADHPRIGYVRITSFSENTSQGFERVLAQLAQTPIDALIIDLRNNGGGYLDNAVHIVNQFVAEGMIIATHDRDGNIRQAYRADGNAPYTRWPIAVLINRFSASASEIVAASLQDHHRAAIVGERSYGKATVQQVLLMESGHSDLKLTTGTYWRPSGANIHRSLTATDADDWGVTPDPGLKMKLSESQEKAWFEFRRRRDRRPSTESQSPPETVPPETVPPATISQADPQLQAAIDRLVEELAKPAAR